MLDILPYLGLLVQGAIILGFALVLGSTAWGIVETKHRNNKDYF